MSKYSKVEKWDGSRFIVMWDPQKVEGPDGEVREEFAHEVLVPAVTKAAITEAIIRTKYSLSDEIALLRQKSSKKAEFNEYDGFADAAIATAEAILKDQGSEEKPEEKDDPKEGEKEKEG